MCASPVSPPTEPAPRRLIVVPRLPMSLPALRHRNYRLFFAGQLVSVTGTWMQTLAQAWLVLTLSSSALALGLVSLLQFSPILGLGLIAGVVADRFPKRTVLVVTQSAAALQAGTLAVLVATDQVRLWHVYALALGLGIINAFDMPTRQAFVVELVGKDDLMNAIALNSSVFNAGRLVGPALAGLLLASFGTALCFGLNAVSYVAVITGLLAMRLGSVPVERAGSLLSRLAQGLGYVRAAPALLLTISLVGAVAMFGMNFNVWIPLLAMGEFDVGAGGFGMLMSALGAGSLLGALSLALLLRAPRPRLMLATAATLGAGELALAAAAAIPAPVGVALALAPVLGLAMTSTMAMANTLVQTVTPHELRGRVMSVYMTVFSGTAPFGAMLAGASAHTFGTAASLALGGTVTLLATTTVALKGAALRRPLPDPAATGQDVLFASRPTGSAASGED